MEIAELRDGEAIKGFRPSAKGNFATHDARKIGLDQDRIDANGRYASGRRKAKEFPPGSRKKSLGIPCLVSRDGGNDAHLSGYLTQTVDGIQKLN
jgi:hypothetical protein